MITTITKRDNEIIKYLETYHYCTIRQINKIFFAKQDFGYSIASKRLGEIVEGGFARIHKDEDSNQNYYIYKPYDEKKVLHPPSKSRIIVLDVLAELKYLGLNVEYFKPEKWWMDGQIKSDAFMIFTLGDGRYYYFVEVQISNHPHNLEKYDKLYETGEVQKALGKDFFPRILFITPSDSNRRKIDVQHTEVIHLDTDLNEFGKILIPPKRIQNTK